MPQEQSGSGLCMTRTTFLSKQGARHTSAVTRKIAIMPNGAADHFVRCGIRELAALRCGGTLAQTKGETDETEQQSAAWSGNDGILDCGCIGGGGCDRRVSVVWAGGPVPNRGNGA